MVDFNALIALGGMLNKPEAKRKEDITANPSNSNAFSGDPNATDKIEGKTATEVGKSEKKISDVTLTNAKAIASVIFPASENTIKGFTALETMIKASVLQSTGGGNNGAQGAGDKGNADSILQMAAASDPNMKKLLDIKKSADKLEQIFSSNQQDLQGKSMDLFNMAQQFGVLGDNKLLNGAAGIQQGITSMTAGEAKIAQGSAMAFGGAALIAQGTAMVAQGVKQVADGVKTIADGNKDFADSSAKSNQGEQTTDKANQQQESVGEKLAKFMEKTDKINKLVQKQAMTAGQQAVQGNQVQDGLTDLESKKNAASQLLQDPNDPRRGGLLNPTNILGQNTSLYDPNSTGQDGANKSAIDPNVTGQSLMSNPMNPMDPRKKKLGLGAPQQQQQQMDFFSNPLADRGNDLASIYEASADANSLNTVV